MSATDPRVEAHLAKARSWKQELLALRRIALEAGLTEELKWYQPCYTHAGGNVLILGSFKDFCTMSFFKGVLLKDPKGLLVSPGPNTRSARMARITSLDEVHALEPALKRFIAEAKALEEQGIQVDFASDRANTPVPVELREAMADDPELHAAFKALTPGRQRGYLLHIGGAKQSATRTARIAKCRDRILAGKGWNER
ncbi:MAG: YdeI/OmpD-associated family protein [Flavobacteriales bacterium]|nr:YdeI/OmpD-associated family protein [Flavobacteriales bacterium]